MKLKMTEDPEDFEGRWPDMDRACDAFEAADCPGDRGRGNLEFKLRAALAVLCPQQAEPVAWYDPTNKIPRQAVTFSKADRDEWPHIYKEPLYLHPPAADVQGLRDAAQAVVNEHTAHGGLRTSVFNPLVNALRRALEGK